MEKYYCVSCGEPIVPEERKDKLMVSLSHAALDGATETMIDNTPVYVTMRELEVLINRKDENGRQYLTLQEYVAFAYNKRNFKYLRSGAAENAKETFEQFHHSIQIEDERSERMNSGDSDYYEEGSILLPGFNETVSEQLRVNFPNDICYLNWELDESLGYEYHLVEKADAKDRVTHYWRCVNCGEQVLNVAFKNRQVLIGVLGFKSAGKTCLIAALCKSFGGYLYLPDSYNLSYKEQLEDFVNGYSMAKTESITTVNTFHPSILKDGILWTFVDIPGEMFYEDNKKQLVNIDTIKDKPEFSMALKCHLYLIAVNSNKPHQFSETNRGFKNFADYSDQHYSLRINGGPVIYALTQVDKVTDNEKTGSTQGLNKYPKKYREELFVFRNKGFQFERDFLKQFYVFPITCSAYGFQPCDLVDPKTGFTAASHKKEWIAKYKEDHPWVGDEDIPHPQYAEGGARPRNVDLIIDWLKKLYGVSEYVIPRSDELWAPRDISKVNRKDKHVEDEDLVQRIQYMFMNPSELDSKLDAVSGENILIKRIKTYFILRKYKDRVDQDE